MPIDFSVENTDRDHLSIQLTQNRISESGQLLHIRLNGLVTVYGTTFFAKVFDSQKDELGQDVVAGDASPEGESDRLSVQGQLRNELVLDLDVNVPAFSPNGDGINDNLRISYILLRALQEVRVDLSLYDLSGSLVRRLQDAGGNQRPTATPVGRTRQLRQRSASRPVSTAFVGRNGHRSRRAGAPRRRGVLTWGGRL